MTYFFLGLYKNLKHSCVHSPGAVNLFVIISLSIYLFEIQSWISFYKFFLLHWKRHIQIVLLDFFDRWEMFLRIPPAVQTWPTDGWYCWTHRKNSTPPTKTQLKPSPLIWDPLDRSRVPLPRLGGNPSNFFLYNSRPSVVMIDFDIPLLSVHQ